MDDARYIAHMFEEMRGELRAVHEAVGDIQQKVSALPAMRQDIDELKQDVKVVKASVRSMTSQMHDHEFRISGLETA